MVNGTAPASLQEALEIRASRSVVPYAGGTDLMIRPCPGAEYLFLNRIQELKRIRRDETWVRIGAAVTFAEALESGLVPQIMKDAVVQIAAPAIRNAGTFGGNLGNGSAKADSVLIETAADAKIRLVSLRGERTIGVEEFYPADRQTALAGDELIAEILLPAEGLDQYYFEKVGGRNALAISRVSFAGVFAAEDGRITNLSAAFGAVAGRVLRFRDLEAMLVGRTVEEAAEHRQEFLDAVAERLVLTSGRVSADYRKNVCLRLLGEYLNRFGIR